MSYQKLQKIERDVVLNIKLQDTLNRRNISQRQLSQGTGIRQQTINDMCTNDVSLLTVENIERICTFLGCELSEVMTMLPIEMEDTRNKKDKKRQEARLNSKSNESR